MEQRHQRLEAATEWLRELTAFETVPGRSNKPMAARIAARLADECSARVLQKDGGNDNTSLLAVIGPEVGGGVALSGHTDVVETAGQQWSASPFALAEKDGKLFARGACDMKGFLACALASAPMFAQAKLRRPILLAFSRDEEIACAGSEDMLALIAESGLKPSAAIVGEPTRMKIVAAHKTGLTMRTVFRGVAAHSSMPKAGVSAIPFAARFVSHLQDLESAMTARAESPSPFDPPHGTINVGTIRGGTALNIFAEECAMDWHYRGMPEDDMDAFAAGVDSFLQNELLPQMRQGGHAASIVNTRLSSYPGLIPRPSPALTLAEELTGDSGRRAVSFGTEAGHFQQHGIDAVVVGPGDINQAHKPDEYIEISQLEECLRFMDRLCARMEKD